jgi:two-component system cell cycle sensor histidine kinase/response regulator CckA
VLERAGFEVRVAATAEDALVRFESGGEQLDILMTDVILPGRNGLDLARQLRARLPALKVLLVSGYGDRAEVRDAEITRVPGTTYLAKPFTSSGLVEAVRSLL